MYRRCRWASFVGASGLMLTVLACGREMGSAILTPSAASELAGAHDALVVQPDGKLAADPNTYLSLSNEEKIFVDAAILLANSPPELADLESDPVEKGAATQKIRSWTESVESDLDVIVKFTGDDWKRVKDDAKIGQASWAAKKVIKELGKYSDDPEGYFASLPHYATAGISFKTRIKMEIIAHVLRSDNEMRFSEWWITKWIWD